MSNRRPRPVSTTLVDQSLVLNLPRRAISVSSRPNASVPSRRCVSASSKA